MEFIQDRWFVVLGAIIALFIVVRLVKTVVKWVLIIAVIAGLYYYGASYKDQLLELGTTVGAQAATENPDGTFTVMTKSVRLDGKPGDSDVKVTFMNSTFTVKMDDVIKPLVDQAKKNAGIQ
jgi:hypothetical protein